MPLQTRLQPISSVNAEARTVDVQWTAGATVLRYDWYRDRPYVEDLSCDDGAVRMDRLTSGRAPLLNDHDRWGGLEQEGFRQTYVWQDGPNASYPDHTHASLTAHIILDGEMTLAADGKSETFRVSQRCDVPAGATHSARMGSKGCRYLVGEK